jgi:hypothetical protein
MANRRDTNKASDSTDLPARQPRKRALSDRVTKADFGDLQTRPSPPPQREPDGRKLMVDSGAPEEVDLPSPFSFSTGAEKPE